MDDVEFVVAIAKGGEDDPVTIRRPGGAEVVAAIGDFDQACAIHVDNIDVPIALFAAIKGKFRAIR